jgi:hypothetical protein
VGIAAWEFPSSGANDIQRPLAACSAPSALGITRVDKRFPHGPHYTSLVQVYQPFSPDRLYGTLYAGSFRQHRSQVWSIGSVWLGVIELLSLGSPPQQLPTADAGQVDLIPLSKENPLNGQSFRAVKGRTHLKAGVLTPCRDNRFRLARAHAQET